MDNLLKENNISNKWEHYIKQLKTKNKYLRCIKTLCSSSKKMIPTSFSGSPQKLLKYLALSLLRQPSDSSITTIKETYKRIQMSKVNTF